LLAAHQVSGFVCSISLFTRKENATTQFPLNSAAKSRRTTAGHLIVQHQQYHVYIISKKRQKWLFTRSLTQNKPGLKKFHDLTLFHGARPHGTVVL
jgi:hypothetical protein